jgi:hypothetical protein
MTELHPATPHIDRISHFKSIESIKKHFYNISPIPGSQHLVFTYPDAEIAPVKISQSRKFPQLLFFPSYHHFRPHSDIPSPSAQVPTCFGANPDLGRAFSKFSKLITEILKEQSHHFPGNGFFPWRSGAVSVRVILSQIRHTKRASATAPCPSDSAFCKGVVDSRADSIL